MNADDRNFWKSRHLCCNCHMKDAYTMNGRALCAECADKANKAKKRDYAERGDEIRQRNRNAYAERKANGLCVKCGKPKEPGNTRVRCLRCTRKQSRAEHIKLENEAPLVRNYPRGDNGICYICNRNPIAPGKRCCDGCYPALKGAMLHARVLVNADIHIWRN